MDKIAYLDMDKKDDDRTGEVYRAFIDYAFEKTDYFMLVYINHFGHGYTKDQKYFKKALWPYRVCSRANPVWPGSPGVESPNTTYKIMFYRNDPRAKEILKEKSAVSEWTWGSPEDLAFFKGSTCWFCSTGHEDLATVIHADEEDIAFLDQYDLIYEYGTTREEIEWYDFCNEPMLDKVKKG